MSKKTFPAQEWENVPSKQEPACSTVQPLNETPTDLHVEVERVVADIEARGIDIAPQYDTWVNIGFALSEGLGKGGRDFFHRLSRLHPDYDYSTTDKQFPNCLNGKGTGVTIASFFHHAALSGVRLSHSPVTILPNYQNSKMAKWVKLANELPRFPETFFDGLPLFLLKVVSNAISSEDRDIILLGAIGCLSVCFDNVCVVYDERVVYSNLYLFVVADAGMGKGALSLCRELVDPLNQRLNEQSMQMALDYKRDLSEYQKNKGKNPDAAEPNPPPLKTLVVPANSSASSLMSILADNDGRGLIFETEGDTLSQTLKSEHGNYSDMLRKSFHHERISMSRRKDREYLEIDNPRISVVLAGTPEQVRHLIPDAENGLLCRFIFYFIPFRRGIRDVFDTDDIGRSKHAIFKTIGNEFLHLLDKFLD